MPPSLTRPDFDTAPHGFSDRPRAGDRLPLGSAGAIIFGLSVAAWIVVVQGVRLVMTLVG